MLDLNNIGIFIIQTLGGLYLSIIILRFFMQLTGANFYNPICQMTFKVTQNPVKTIRYFIPSIFNVDISSLIFSIFVEMAVFMAVLSLSNITFSFSNLFIWSLIGVMSQGLKIIFVSMIVSVILSWVAPGSTNPTAEVVIQITEPMLIPLRRLLPSLGGLDISPLLTFMTIQLLQSYLIPSLAIYFYMPLALFRII